MKSGIHKAIVALSMTLVAGSLSSCSGEDSSKQVSQFFGNPQTAEDILPPVNLPGDMDVSNSRKIGQDSTGTRYFVVRGRSDGPSESSICLVLVQTNDSWVGGCSDQFPITVGASSPRVTAKLMSVKIEGSLECPKGAECVGGFIEVRHEL